MDKLLFKILRFMFNKQYQKFISLDKRLKENEKVFHAIQMLENPIFNEAVSEMKAELISMWEQSSHRDVDGRENIHRTFKIIEGVKLKFEAYANKMKFEELVKEREKEYQEMIV